ncbi:MAG: hypothetical protein V1784_06365 [bacterium]
MRVAELIDKVDMKALNQVYDKEITGGLVTDLAGEVKTSGKAGHIWVAIQTDKNGVAAANLVDIAAIVVTEGNNVANDVLQAADSAQITVCSTLMTSWDLVGGLYALGIRISPYSPSH